MTCRRPHSGRGEPAIAERRPNVILILTDDQGPWAAGCCGNPEIRTPNINRLAENGLRFENFFCTSPVCSPTRASLLTGRIPSQHGVHDFIRKGNMPPNPAAYTDAQKCYTDILAAHGWSCGLSGKWHLGDSLQPQHGFSHWVTMPHGASRYNDAEIIRDGRVETAPGYLTDVWTEEALRFIDGHRDEPFYLSLHYNAPHAPWRGHPEQIVASYDDCPFESCPQEAAHPWVRPDLRDRLGDRESLKGYFAAVTALDAGVGRVLDRLEELGLREDTLVVFTSDNGFSCGHHGFWGKGNGTFPVNMYENSVKVPFIVSRPGSLPEGRVTPAMMSQYDFMPTLLNYLGLPAPEDDALPGASFLPVWTGEADQGRDEVVVYDEYGPTRMIRTRRWKYVHRYPFGPHELYNLREDPGEQNNLWGEEVPDAAEDLRRRLARWFGRYADPALDGARGPVTGWGQVAKIDRDHPLEGAFAGDVSDFLAPD
ncbi:MAG: sulfatase [Planctomycetota bacterium]